MSNLHHHPHTKLQPPAVPNQHRTSTEERHLLQTQPCVASKGAPAKPHRMRPRTRSVPLLRISVAQESPTRQALPGGICTASTRLDRRGRRAAPTASARGRVQAPRQGRAQRELRAAARPDCDPAPARRRHHGTSSAARPGAGPQGRRRLSAAATGRCRPSRTGPGEAALTGRRGEGAGPRRAVARGAALAAGTAGESGRGESRAAPASPVPAGPARLRRRRSRLCRVQLPPGPRVSTNQCLARPAPPTSQRRERVPAQRHRPPGHAHPASRQAYPVTREGAVPGAQRPMRNHSASCLSQWAAAQRCPSERAGGRRERGVAGLSRHVTAR